MPPDPLAGTTSSRGLGPTHSACQFVAPPAPPPFLLLPTPLSISLTSFLAIAALRNRLLQLGPLSMTISELMLKFSFDLKNAGSSSTKFDLTFDVMVGHQVLWRIHSISAMLQKYCKCQHSAIYMQVCTAASIMWVLGPPSTSLQTIVYLAIATVEQDEVRLACIYAGLVWPHPVPTVVLYSAIYSLNGQDVRPTSEWSDIRQFWSEIVWCLTINISPATCMLHE